MGDLMKTALVGFNAKYIHKNLALRWLYVSKPAEEDARIFEFTIKDDAARVANVIKEYQPDIVAISVYIWNVEIVREFITKIRELLPACRINLGGPEVSFENDEWFEYPIDSIIQGEGEISFWKYVQNEIDVDGLRLHNNKPLVEYAKVPLRYLEKLECPYFLEIDKDSMHNRYLYVETSRGCPYRCSYCLASLDNQVRIFSEEYMDMVFDRLEQSSVRQVKFLDRTFNIKPTRALSIAKRLGLMPNDISFQFEVVAETLSNDLLEYFINYEDRSKFRFEIGLQSFNDEALKSVNRIQDNEKLVGVIKRMQQANCIMHVDLIAGLPFEDLVSFKETFNRLYSLHIDEIQVGILKLLKGTELKSKLNEYEMEFSNKTPYTIIKNKWLSNDDISIVEDVYHAVEKCWNSSKLKNTIKYLTDKGYPSFDLFARIGKGIRTLPSPYQTRDLFMILLEIENDIIPYVLTTDYYRLFKQRPKRLVPFNLEGEQLSKLNECLLQYGLKEKELYHYGMLDYGYYNGECCYQCVVYNSKQTLPRRYFVSKDYKNVREEIL